MKVDTKGLIPELSRSELDLINEVSNHPNVINVKLKGKGTYGEYLTDFCAAPAVVGKKNRSGSYDRRVGWVHIGHFAWVDRHGRVHFRPHGTPWDGASKPSFTNVFLGHTDKIKWLIPSLLHDGMGTDSLFIKWDAELDKPVLYTEDISIWEGARLMYDAMRDAGSSRWRAQAAKLGLRTFQYVGRLIKGETHWELLSTAPEYAGAIEDIGKKIRFDK